MMMLCQALGSVWKMTPIIDGARRKGTLDDFLAMRPQLLSISSTSRGRRRPDKAPGIYRKYALLLAIRTSFQRKDRPSDPTLKNKYHF